MKVEFYGTLDDIIKEMNEFMENREDCVNPKVEVLGPNQEKVNQTDEVPVVPVAPTITYTLEDLQKIAGEFLKKKPGNRQILLDILASLEVKAITHLSDSQYGIFIKKLKDAGADI